MIKGTVRKIIYKSDTNFIVGVFKIRYTEYEEMQNYVNKTITFTGTFLELRVEGDYIFYGDLITHSKYGYQFKVNNYEQVMPEDKDSIIAFLSSDLFPNIGYKTAIKIVDVLKEEAIDKILDNYENLLLVPSLTIKKAKMIYDILSKESNSYKTIIYLQKLGFSINESSKIYNKYKEETINIIEDNIYQIVEDILGIGFLTIDRIAINLNEEYNSERRIKACILYIMSDLCLKNGHTYNIKTDIYLGIKNYLGFDLELSNFDYYLLILNKEGKVIIDDNKYYLKKYYETESMNAITIGLLCKETKEININLDKYIKNLEKRLEIKYNDEQKNAIKESIRNNFLIITGGPGTGKTTIIKAIVELYKDINKIDDSNLINSIALLAPTGRAAKRIIETSCFPAMTIHKFLKWNKETNSFGINENNKSSVNLVIIDEVSMIDNMLLNCLFKGLKTNIKVIFVGDHNQLPSVGPGQVLKDLIESNKIPVIELNYLYRQQKNSYIINLAYEINNGELSSKYLEKHDDYNFIECSRNDIKRVIVELCKKAENKKFAFKDIQVLVPMYKGINGIDTINNMLQEVFNPKHLKKFEIEHLGVIYREGDKVLQIKNNNDLNVSNGDIGIIESINKVDSKIIIIINFDNELVEYSLKDFDDIRLGYAISIHKAQGSEFDIVIIPMDLSFSKMLYRKLIYTAVTRTKKFLMLVGDNLAFKMAVLNERDEKRQTSLKEMVIKQF